MILLFPARAVIRNSVGFIFSRIIRVSSRQVRRMHDTSGSGEKRR
jgi:hypothetical protein